MDNLTPRDRSVSSLTFWRPALPKPLAAIIGTAFLLAAVVGSGIMAETLTDDVGLQLLQNAFATAPVLTALILAFGGVSGPHLNPVVTLTERMLGGIDTPMAGAYIVAPFSGAIAGTVTASVMFDLPTVAWSVKDRSAGHIVFAEGIATLGLLLIIFGTMGRGKPCTVAFAVGGNIGGAHYFTSSTSFANPAVIAARMFSDTFAGIAPASVPAFLGVEAAAVVVAIGLIRLCLPPRGAPEES